MPRHLHFPILCLLFATAQPIATPCSDIQNAGGFTNATLIAERLALLENEEVMSFVDKAEQENVSEYNLYQCTYAYESDPVIVATAICDASNLDNCVVLATYSSNSTQCPSAKLCPDILNHRPSFTVDCSGIQDAYPNCELTCSSNTSYVTGMETCTAVNSAGAPTAAPGSGSGSDNKTSSGSRRYTSLGSLSLFLGLLLSR